MSGDAYCFDLNAIDKNGDARIVLITHDINFDGMSFERVKALAKPVATSLAEFLQQFLDDRIDEECIYEPD